MNQEKNRQKEQESQVENREENQRVNRKINHTGQRNAVLCVLFVIGALAAGSVCVSRWRNRAQAEEKLQQLSENTLIDVEIPKQAAPEAVQQPGEDNTKQDADQRQAEWLNEMGIPNPGKEVDFTDLQENTNADIYAWIYIPDTKIDYPVVQHPSDNTYYLNYNLDGSKGYPGCIYTENYNEKDFSDPNTVLYGHNMKNGSMFAGLHKFKDSEYFETHPYIYIYTPEGMKVYRIFAAYEYGSSHLLLNFDLENPTMFQSYLDGILDRRDMNSNLRKDVELTADNRILTLSTCIANKPENRYLVQGVLLNED